MFINFKKNNLYFIVFRSTIGLLGKVFKETRKLNFNQMPMGHITHIKISPCVFFEFCLYKTLLVKLAIIIMYSKICQCIKNKI